MKLHILNSRSLGNSYLLQSDNEILAIEAGVSFDKVKEVLNFDISKMVGVVVSHAHQ